MRVKGMECELTADTSEWKRTCCADPTKRGIRVQQEED